jgi:hypothetical protein
MYTCDSLAKSAVGCKRKQYKSSSTFLFSHHICFFGACVHWLQCKDGTVLVLDMTIDYVHFAQE